MAIAGWGSLILLASSLSGWRRLGTGSNSILAPFHRIQDRERAVIMLLAHLGLRAGEVIRLSARGGGLSCRRP